MKDDAKADKKEIEGIDGVIGVVNSGGQFQVIIGNDVSVEGQEHGPIEVAICGFFILSEQVLVPSSGQEFVPIADLMII